MARKIPMKQIHKERNPSRTQKIVERVSKASDNHNVKKASSPRASKFPPVRLRVDPFPRKKTNGTSSSRSPNSLCKGEESKDKVVVKAEEKLTSSDVKVGIETKNAEEQLNLQSKE